MTLCRPPPMIFVTKVLRSCLWAIFLCVMLAQPVYGGGWSFALQQGRMDIDLPDYENDAWKAVGIRAKVVNSIQASSEQLRVTFKPGSHLVIGRVDGPGVELHNVRVNLDGVGLTVELGSSDPLPERTRIDGQLSVDIGELTHPRLIPQQWRFEGMVHGALAGLELNGRLESGAGLVLDLSLRNQFDDEVIANLRLSGAAQAAGNVLSATLNDWPELLSLDSGELVLETSLRIQPGAPLTLDARLEFTEVSGIVDRTAVTGLSGRLLLGLEDEEVSAGLRDFWVKEVDSGIGVGPIRLLADYQAEVASPLAGKLALHQATADFLGGRLRIAPRTVDFSAQPWHLPLEVYDLSLEQVLQLYPTEGLSGTGRLTGRLPIRVTRSGVEVERGTLFAEAPGGVLTMPADRLRALLGGSDAMALVVQALQNFHYSVLSSTIHYDEKGKLSLGVKLEGENPDYRGGQPVVLNINLEEDIPALLTSLQLSGRVNEAVTERVRERLKQSGQEAVP